MVDIRPRLRIWVASTIVWVGLAGDRKPSYVADVGINSVTGDVTGRHSPLQEIECLRYASQLQRFYEQVDQPQGSGVGIRGQGQGKTQGQGQVKTQGQDQVKTHFRDKTQGQAKSKNDSAVTSHQVAVTGTRGETGARKGDRGEGGGIRKKMDIPIGENIMFGRRLVYSHHIINPNKRAAVVNWAIELGLSGCSKIGWPGVIVVEGLEQNVREYIHALSRLKWKYLAVRGEEVLHGKEGDTVDSLRAFPRGFQEFGVDCMSEMAKLCRDCGVESLFQTLFKKKGLSESQ
ncbi:hypothetical protein AAMO2058_000641400 [Amorphochlora amoebiformis]